MQCRVHKAWLQDGSNISNNTAARGGGIALYHCAALLSMDTNFVGKSADESGGGMLVVNEAAAVLMHC